MKKIIVITGASSGIGREFFVQLKDKNVDEFWVIARRADRLEELKNLTDKKVVPITIDLSVTSQIDVYKVKLAQENPQIDMLINCSGFGKFEHYENIDSNTNLNMIDLNCKAVVRMVDYSLNYFAKGSKIINIASCAGFQPIPYINIYASTKAFVLSYSRALNRELKYRGISVTAVCPYWTKTEFFDRAVDQKAKTVIIKYNAMYNAKDVVKKALKDSAKGKDMSVYGGQNNFQKFLSKILPHRFIMKAWENMQKFNGTKDIR